MEIKVRTDGDGNSTYIPAASSVNPLFIDQEMHAALLGNCPNVRRRSEIMGNPLDMTEMMIAREMEKRRIREEILTVEQLLRRRELEAEVVREIMMEREIFMQQGSLGLPLAADSLLRRPEGQGFLSLGRRHGFGIGERSVTGLSWQEGRSDGTLSMVRQEGGGALGGSLFQCQPEAAMATHGIAIKPIYDLSKGQVLPMVKPTNSSVAGIKRKFEALVAECGDGTPSVNVGKEIQKEWSCVLCHVTATSERNLQEHLKGRKHKAKERALRESNTKVNNNANNSEALAEEPTLRPYDLETHSESTIRNNPKTFAGSEEPNMTECNQELTS
ncbi:hypothetical protein LOK49_LG13G02778 [Camellia lanceoleosa]|uniref:Uncharacterized protein n=1 Tax=Camellia lanceoleosa TaxID=1840588 RepID=A0ACC0FGG5_9ERIC|nr:hypothetical protein LOK49_LG13G02778 [Camellia lanceoleosa]